MSPIYINKILLLLIPVEDACSACWDACGTTKSVAEGQRLLPNVPKIKWESLWPNELDLTHSECAITVTECKVWSGIIYCQIS